MSSAARILLAVVAFVIGIAFFPHDCDGAFYVYDGAAYGMQAQKRMHETINPHHPLLHLVALVVVPGLEALGVTGPGHVAFRLFAGLAAAWIMWQIVGLAGRRAWVGAGFALFVLCTWGFVVSAAVGETLLPATAAALWAFRAAAQPEPRLATCSVALALALLCRQDNILILPGFVLALARALRPGARTRGVLITVGAAGVLTLVGYAIAWLVVKDSPIPQVMRGNPVRWMMWFGHEEWEGGRRFDRYLTSLAACVTGAQWPRGEHHPWPAVAYVATLVAAGVLLRGTEARRALVLPVVITLAARAAFHTWFEAANYEWLVLPIVFLAATLSGLACGAPATPRLARRAGAALLVALTAWTIHQHTPELWRMRERNLMDTAADATAVDRTKWDFLIAGLRAAIAVDMLGVKGTTLEVEKGVEVLLDGIGAKVKASRRPTVVVFDRYGFYCSPWEIRNPAERRQPLLDDLPDAPGYTFLRRDGLTYGIRVLPELLFR